MDPADSPRSRDDGAAPAAYAETEGVSRTPFEPISAPAAGDLVGRYRLLEKLGEGGCGVVYLAEQSEPVRRRVALKVIKLGMDTKAVIARFEGERQALALMEHPNIAKVYDAGATELGRPYFVMELVRGMRITDYCDRHATSTRERLGLFIQVCQAVQHAHQKGIIHRDLKPSNILVAMQDGVPVPKIIDFGIAKTMHGRLTDSTVFTRQEQFVGTPAYMSPEQAELSGLDLDTRSDIYSLGVVLYELLTSQPPFDPQTLGTAGLDELRRVIREVEPPRPSHRLGTLGPANLAGVAKQRAASAAQLTTELRGDLDWIVMKAIEKQRNRRYDSAAALAADVTRYLENEPVIARPPSRVYRARKFVRRHQVAVGAAAAVALALMAGAAFATWQAVRARAAERVASGERAEAQRSRDRAEDLLAFMLGDLRTQLSKVGRLDVLEAVGEKAMEYFASLNPRELTDTTLARQAKALTQIGEIRVAQLRYPEAAAAFAAAYDRAETLAARHPRNGEMLFERAQAEYWIGFVHWRRRDLAAASTWLVRYRDSGAALQQLGPANLRWQREAISGQHNLAVLEVERGNLGTAREGFLAELAAVQRLQAAAPDDLNLQFRVADAESWLGSVAEREGALAEAVARFGSQVERLRRISDKDPGTARWRQRLADAMGLQTVVLSVSGRRAEALALSRQTLEILEALAKKDRENRDWRRAAANSYVREAMFVGTGGDWAAALTRLREVRTEVEEPARAESSDWAAVALLAYARRLEARALMELNRVPEAREAAARAVETLGSLKEGPRLNEATRAEFAQACLVAGSVAQRTGDASAARRHWELGWEAVREPAGTSRFWKVLDPAARLLLHLGRSDEGRRIIERLSASSYQPLEPWP